MAKYTIYTPHGAHRLTKAPDYNNNGVRVSIVVVKEVDRFYPYHAFDYIDKEED